MQIVVWWAGFQAPGEMYEFPSTEDGRLDFELLKHRVETEDWDFSILLPSDEGNILVDLNHVRKIAFPIVEEDPDDGEEMDTDVPIGWIDEVQEFADGLHVRGHLNDEDDRKAS